MEHRTLGYSLLTGAGIEIGALHNPARVPARCKVAYCDAMTATDAKKSFPELAELPLVAVDHVVDLDQSGLSGFTQGSQDFVILNHVIEHVANPIHVIAECFRVLRSGGLLVLSAPDMRFTFDKTRALTTAAHLWDECEQGVTRVSDAHYEDFLNAVHPEVNSDPQRFADALVAVRDRREHAHVWDSHTFGLLLREILDRRSIAAQYGPAPLPSARVFQAGSSVNKSR